MILCCVLTVRSWSVFLLYAPLLAIIITISIIFTQFQHHWRKDMLQSPASLQRIIVLFSNKSHNISLKARKPRFLTKCFFKDFFRFVGFLIFNLQMPDTKLRPRGTMKGKDKSSKQFGHVNATNSNSYWNIIFMELVTNK